MSTPAEALARARAFAGRRLSAEEFAAGLAVPMSDEEKADARALIAWFCRRYPTPAERLAYVRRAHARWKRNQPAGNVTR